MECTVCSYVITTHFQTHTHAHSMIFWLGDLNYRIQTSPEMTPDQIKAHANNYQIPTMLKFDQLLSEMKRENVFQGFKEGPIDFKPTYKYDPNTDDWDSRWVWSIGCGFTILLQ